MCDIRFLMIEAMPRDFGLHAFEHRAAVHAGVDDDQVVQVGGPPVLGIGQGALQHLLQQPRPAVRLKAEDFQGLVGKLPANQVGQRPDLAGTDLRKAMGCSIGHDYFLPPLPP